MTNKLKNIRNAIRIYNFKKRYNGNSPNVRLMLQSAVYTDCYIVYIYVYTHTFVLIMVVWM